MHKNYSYKVLAVEDEPKILRNVIRKIEAAGAGFEVAGKAANGAEALELVDELSPDVLITDIRMPRMDGLELIRLAKDKKPDIQVIILSGYDEFEYAQKAIKLGVMDYLLKPVEESSLKEVLASIKSRLDERADAVEKKSLVSSIHRQAENFEFPYMFDNAKFYLLLICMGNLCGRVESDELHTHYEKRWNGIRWETMLSGLSGWQEDGKWWLIDEKHPNQKFLLFFSSSLESCNIHNVSQQLMDALAQQLHPDTVSICPGEKAVPYKEIWELAQQLRRTLEQGVVMGKPMLITSRGVEANSKLPPLLDSVNLERISFLLQSGNHKMFQKEMDKLFERWVRINYPQKMLEAGMHQLIRHCYTQKAFVSNVGLDVIEGRLAVMTAKARDKQQFFDELKRTLNEIFEPGREENSTDSLAAGLSEYIQRHFTEEITLEGIARKFGISVSYTIKLFKKYHNMTLLQYVIELRIHEAKRLMKENPELDIKSIGEMVGYGDQHYFSRVFKNAVGMSPSEFRGR